MLFWCAGARHSFLEMYSWVCIFKPHASLSSRRSVALPLDPHPLFLLLIPFPSSCSFPLSSRVCRVQPFPFSSNLATGAGGLEISCVLLCFRSDTVINHWPSHTSTYNNKDWLLCGGCRPIAFHCMNAKLEVNGHSQSLHPCPQTVSSFRYLSISALLVELLPALPGGPRLLRGRNRIVAWAYFFGFDSVPIS